MCVAAMGINSRLTHYLIASVGASFVLGGASGSEREVFWQEGHAELLRYLAARNMNFAELIHALSYT